MKHTFILGLALFTLLSACKKDDVDNTAPEITLNNPAMNQTLTIGSTIDFSCDFTDDVELKSYKIDIHSAAGHTHDEKSASVIEEGHPWTYEKSWDFEKGLTQQTISNSLITVPDSVIGEEGLLEPVLTGEYHFGVYCTDVSGNESHVYIDVVIE